MKKLLLSLMALALLFVVSCQDDKLSSDKTEEVSVNLKVRAPEAMGITRASEILTNSGKGGLTNVDWTTIDLRYILEIYDADGTTLIKEREVLTKEKYEDAVFNLNLITGREYKFVIWADFVTKGSSEDFHYNTADLSDVKIKDEKIHNETYDAYFITQNIVVVNGLSETLTLTRPFGKLRLIATDITGINVSKITVKYETEKLNSINAITGKLNTGKMTTNTFTATIDKDAYKQGYDNDSDKQTLFVDYIYGKEGEQMPVHFQFTAYDDNNDIIQSSNFNTDIPIQRNWLTTIIGDLLTTSSKITVNIDESFEGERKVSGISAAYKLGDRLDSQNMNLVWADEFDTDGLVDETNWTYESGYVRNKELQYYTVRRPENCRIEGGKLIITGRTEDTPYGDKNAQYTSASIITNKKKSWKYGRFEIYAKLPSGTSGIWPAFWAKGDSQNTGSGWPSCGEIDIMEYAAKNPKQMIQNVIFGKRDNNTPVSSSITKKYDATYVFSEDYHKYSLNWNETQICFAIDDIVTHVVNMSDIDSVCLQKGYKNPFHQPFSLLLNLSLGTETNSSLGGILDPEVVKVPKEFIVDYVRIYQAY